jgi:hypothetical protein
VDLPRRAGNRSRAGGRAVRDAEPAGRLPQTWYRGDDPLPKPLDYDIIKAGWTYQYHRAAPLYPFGHGLSYTDFAHRDLRLSDASIAQDGEVGITDAGEARLELRAGDRLLAEIGVPVTGDSHTWTSTAAEFATPLDGIHDLTLTLHGGFRPAAFSLVTSD